MENLNDFDYALPPSRIAARPPRTRDGGRLLDLSEAGPPVARQFIDLPTLLRAGDLLVLNDSRVIPARLLGHKDSGGRVEIFAERFLENGEMLAQVRAARPPVEGAILYASGAFIVVAKHSDGMFHLRAVDRRGKHVQARPRFMRVGKTPLPPYIRRRPDDSDKLRYQTIYARRGGSVAAPTAGLHFSERTFRQLDQRGVQLTRITLHVGAGTFMPLRGGLKQETLHAERFTVPEPAVRKINAARRRGGRIVAVGTTTLRALETAASSGNGVRACEGETNLFIKPGFDFRAADMLLTNFHLPRSSLLVLACAFGGRQCVLNACRFAVKEKFRFYSYGDAMLLARKLNQEN